MGWCCLREDFRHFRIDRIRRLTTTQATFPDQPGRRLGDYFDALEKSHGIKVPRD